MPGASPEPSPGRADGPGDAVQEVRRIGSVIRTPARRGVQRTTTGQRCRAGYHRRSTHEPGIYPRKSRDRPRGRRDRRGRLLELRLERRREHRTAVRSAAAGKYTVGISNPGAVGNGWREAMICSAKAQAVSAGNVIERPRHDPRHRRGRPARRHPRPDRQEASTSCSSTRRSPDALNPAIKEAHRRRHRRRRHRRPGHRAGRLQPVERPGPVRLPRRQGPVRADGQEGRRHLHARHRRPPGRHRPRHRVQEGARRVPGHQGRQGDRHEVGPGHGASPRSTTSSPAALKFDGIWTSGIDNVIVDALKTAKHPFVPIVGADNAGFVKQLLNEQGLKGAAVTNPAAVGGAGVVLGLPDPRQEGPADTNVHVTPELWDNTTTRRQGRADGRQRHHPSRDLAAWPHDQGLDHLSEGRRQGLQGPGRVAAACTAAIDRGCRLRRHPRHTVPSATPHEALTRT